MCSTIQKVIFREAASGLQSISREVSTELKESEHQAKHLPVLYHSPVLLGSLSLERAEVLNLWTLRWLGLKFPA